jgi:YidC/Oxa1 family membrane protein insertase
MADYQHKPDQGPGAERQFFIYMILAFLMVLLFQGIFFKQPPAKAPENPPVASKPPTPTTPAAPAPTKTQPAPAPASKQAASEAEIVVENDLYRVTFTNRGAQVKSWLLKKYQDEKGQPLDLVNQVVAAKMGFPLSLWTYDEGLRKQLREAMYVVTPALAHITVPALPSANAHEITFEYSDGHLLVSKKFSFDHSYVISVETAVKQDGAPVQAYPAWPAALGDQVSPGHYATSRLDWRTPEGVERRVPFEKNWIRPNRWVANGDTLHGTYNWAGVSDQYFAAIFMPAEPRSTAVITLHESVDVAKDPSDPNNKETVKVDALGVAAGNPNGVTKTSLFAGPKAVDVLDSVHSNADDGAAARGPDLEGTIDFGFFGIFAKWLFIWLNWTHDHWISNWGWAIVLLTVIINLALLPTRISQMKMSLKMQKAQPRLQDINKKYEKYSLRDQEKQQQKQKEIMAVYKEEGFNPAGGCLPMLLQLPLLWAFYAVLANTIELRHAPWMWIRDLSAPDPLHILPILTIVTMVALQQMTPQAGMDPAQRRMMNIMMPVMFAGFTWAVSAGLALYWTVGTVISLAMQYSINRSVLGREIRELQEKRARKQKK